jgi:hypothetical protein
MFLLIIGRRSAFFFDGEGDVFFFLFVVVVVFSRVTALLDIFRCVRDFARARIKCVNLVGEISGKHF